MFESAHSIASEFVGNIIVATFIPPLMVARNVDPIFALTFLIFLEALPVSAIASWRWIQFAAVKLHFLFELIDAGCICNKSDNSRSNFFRSNFVLVKSFCNDLSKMTLRTMDMGSTR